MTDSYLNLGSNLDDVYLLTDLHLTKEAFPEEQSLIEQIKKVRYVILMGDIFHANFPYKKFSVYHRELWDALMSCITVWLPGNNDFNTDLCDEQSVLVYYNGIKYQIMHGHQLCHFTKYKILSIEFLTSSS